MLLTGFCAKISLMNVNDLLNVGNSILNDVSRSVESGDFEGLGERTKERVAFAVSQFAATSSQTKTQSETGNRTSNNTSNRTSNRTDTQHRTGSYVSKHNNNRQQVRYTQSSPTSYFLRNPRKKTAGLGKIVAGGIGCFFGLVGSLTAFSTAGALSMLTSASVLSSMGFAASFGVGIFFTAIFLISLGFIFSGTKLRKLVGRYYEYGEAVGNAEYFSIRKLAEKLGISARELTKDIEKMMNINLLRGARMDRNKTTVMLTDKAYEQYRTAEVSRMQREAEQMLKNEQPAPDVSRVDSDVARIIEDGNKAIVYVRQINDEIPDTKVMSDKLYRLEEIMRRIFEQVEKDPSSAGDLRRFMDYYLPTTTKLLSAYVELDRQPVQGDNIRKTKDEIESSLDTINDAFEQLLDSMFSDMAMDISTDISVMKTMMAQDGLADSDNSLFTPDGEMKFQ